MNVDDAADELYGLPLADFVAARDAMAKDAKAAGAKEAAAWIKGLRKPTQAAWVANQLAREDPDGVAELIGLGQQMRKATTAMDGAKLRELTSRRRELVDALLRKARALARDGGQRPSPELIDAISETLLAAVADPDAADGLRTGRLTHGLQHVGFGPVEDDGEPAQVISLSDARTARGQRLETTRPQRQATPAPLWDGLEAEEEPDEEPAADEAGEAGDERSAAEHELEEAESAVEAADDHLDEAEAALDDLRQRLETAQSAVERLTAQLAEARRELEQARDDVETGEGSVDQARKDAEQARRRRRIAKQHLGTLDD